MKMYFMTRKEAREYCKPRNIPYSKIQRNNTGSQSWYVEVNEVTRFEKNKIYKIADEQGFIKRSQFSQVNIANRIQVEQIKKYLPDGFKIIELDHQKQIATFEAPVGVSFNSVHFNEAQFMMEVAPAAKPVVAPVKQPKKPRTIQVDVKPTPDLDAELNGGVSLADEPKEKAPGKFIVGQEYVLKDRAGFVRANANSNRQIANYIEKERNGIFKIAGINYSRSNDCFQLDAPKNINNGTDTILFHNERKFFREHNHAPVVLTTEEIRNNKREELLKNIDNAQKALDVAKEKYAIALDARNKALDELTKAFAALSDFVK